MSDNSLKKICAETTKWPITVETSMGRFEPTNEEECNSVATMLESLKGKFIRVVGGSGSSSAPAKAKPEKSPASAPKPEPAKEPVPVVEGPIESYPLTGGEGDICSVITDWPARIESPAGDFKVDSREDCNNVMIYLADALKKRPDYSYKPPAPKSAPKPERKAEPKPRSEPAESREPEGEEVDTSFFKRAEVDTIVLFDGGAAIKMDMGLFRRDMIFLMDELSLSSSVYSPFMMVEAYYYRSGEMAGTLTDEGKVLFKEAIEAAAVEVQAEIIEAVERAESKLEGLSPERAAEKIMNTFRVTGHCGDQRISSALDVPGYITNHLMCPDMSLEVESKWIPFELELGWTLADESRAFTMLGVPNSPHKVDVKIEVGGITLYKVDLTADVDLYMEDGVDFFGR